MFTKPCNWQFLLSLRPARIANFARRPNCNGDSFPVLCYDYHIDRMTWLACISHYVRGHVHKIGHNYNGTGARHSTRSTRSKKETNKQTRKWKENVFDVFFDAVTLHHNISMRGSYLGFFPNRIKPTKIKKIKVVMKSYMISWQPLFF